MSSFNDFVRCFRCGYDLRETADDSPCPECGLLAIRSRRPTDALRDARPGWLRSLALGVWVILLAIASVPLGLMGVPYLAGQYFSFPMTAMERLLWELATSAGQLVLPTLLLPIGAWFLTRPEGYAAADDADRQRRTAIRVISVVPLIGLTYYVTLNLVSRAGLWGWRPWTADEWVLTAFTLGVSPLPWLGMRQLRGLARRANSRHLQEHCTIVGVGTSLTIALAWTVMMLGMHGQSWGVGYNWFARSAIWMLLMLAATVPAILFWLWALYLMIRFAASFWVESQHLRQAWRSADRASVS